MLRPVLKRWKRAITAIIVGAVGFLSVPERAPRHEALAVQESTDRCESLIGMAPDASIEGRKVPATPLSGQAKPPCYREMDEREIGGACWQTTSKTPPCGALYEHGSNCYRVVYRPERQPTSITK